MDNLARASQAVFGEKGIDPRDTGDQKLSGAITTLEMLRVSPKELRAIKTAKDFIDQLTRFQQQVENPEFDTKIQKLREHYNYEFRVLLAASSKGRRLHVPSDREIRFLGRG